MLKHNPLIQVGGRVPWTDVVQLATIRLRLLGIKEAKRTTTMRWQRLTAWSGLLLAWVALAAWQYHEYGHEQELARQTLRRQADSLMSALVGGIRSHRRMGRFFLGQLQGTLDELVISKDVLAVSIAADDGRPIISAGETESLGDAATVSVGRFWETYGFRFVDRFELSPEPAGSPQPMGRGLGRGSQGWRQHAAADGESRFSSGGTFLATLLLDRAQVDEQCHRAYWLRITVVMAGGIVLLCVAFAWRATIRLADAYGRARLLETETRHLRELSQAATGLAHETRNPLGLIRGWMQRLAQSETHQPEVQQQIRAVIEECDRVTSRINQFLAFARPRQPDVERVDVEQLLGELTTILQPDLNAKNLQLETNGGSPAITVRADREMLRQALFNMIQNAVQFAPEEGTVEVVVAKGQDGRCRIDVADCGPGVPPEDVESLFTPYFTTRPGGTGLGLAIVRHIATAHGWRVEYIPRAGGGSIFRLDRIDA